MKWIPITERLPEPHADLLIAYRNAAGQMIVDAGFVRHGSRFVYLGMETVCVNNVCAWMPFLAPPTMEVEG
jgi:hypothetical protein